MNAYNNGTLQRVNKTQARKYYNLGESIIFCPCNINPVSPWAWGIGVKLNNSAGREFDPLVNEFEYYNCISSETGKYTAFYIKQGV